MFAECTLEDMGQREKGKRGQGTYKNPRPSGKDKNSKAFYTFLGVAVFIDSVHVY